MYQMQAVAAELLETLEFVLEPDFYPRLGGLETPDRPLPALCHLRFTCTSARSMAVIVPGALERCMAAFCEPGTLEELVFDPLVVIGSPVVHEDRVSRMQRRYCKGT